MFSLVFHVSSNIKFLTEFTALQQFQRDGQTPSFNSQTVKVKDCQDCKARNPDNNSSSLPCDFHVHLFKSRAVCKGE